MSIKINSFFCIILFFINSITVADIIESNNLDILLKIARKGDLIVFDVDNTISNPTSYVGTSPWFDKKVTKLVQGGMDKHEAATKMEMVHEFVDLKVICNAAEIIKELQKHGFPVIALTNRALPVVERTIRQMDELDIDFSVTAPVQEDIEFFLIYQAIYTNGMIFSAHNDKGASLFCILSHMAPEKRANIKRIIFVDDRFGHVKSVEKAALQHNVDSICIHLQPGEIVDDVIGSECNLLRKQVFYMPNRDAYNAKVETQRHEKKKKDRCIFCMLAADTHDKKNLLLTRFEYHNLFMNLYPYQRGHLLLIPKKHVANMDELSWEAQQELIKIVSAVPSILKNILGSEGTNVGINIGKIAGASKPNHLHIHIIPRYEIEYVSFAHLISETLTITYDMATLYDKLKVHFDELRAHM